jgi:hypothetical protein
LLLACNKSLKFINVYLCCKSYNGFNDTDLLCHSISF